VGLNKDVATTAEFYDRWTEVFLNGFGPVLQAGILKTGDPEREHPERSVLELARRARIRDGDRLLDAGCGVGGPATIIANRYPNVSIDGVTLSPKQAEIARIEIAVLGLADRVRVHVADYEQLPLRSVAYDRILFFETTGYATDLDLTYREAHRILRPGGGLYVKDVFQVSHPLSEDEHGQMEAFDELWGCARTKTITESVRALESAGFEVQTAGPLPGVGTSRLVGAMYSLDDTLGLRQTELGAAFARRGLDPPIVFGEIRAIRP
jgi:ubiquinone/menaquinone biosynthesis C-methylase UbiE